MTHSSEQLDRRLIGREADVLKLLIALPSWGWASNRLAGIADPGEVLLRFGIPGSAVLRFLPRRFSAAGGTMARPRDEQQKDLFRPALDRIIDQGQSAGGAGLLILKHMHSPSDEAAVRTLAGEPVFQFFLREQVSRHGLPFDHSSLSRWRQRLGEERLSIARPFVWTKTAKAILAKNRWLRVASQ
jgi:hypothetical protein